jgi:flavin-dependent dehydrogenase
LIGDAGHFVRPLEGEGIYYSLLSGSKAAEVINNAMEAGDVGTGNLSRFDDWFRTDVRPRFAALHRELLFVLQLPRLVDMCISLSCRSAWVAKRFSVCGDYLP